MPVIVGTSEKNELEFKSDEGTVVLYWKDPTSKQRIRYSNRIVRRQGMKIKMDHAGTRLAGGKAICTGMREGDFAIKADNEAGYILISSDPSSPDYKKDWKELLESSHADYLILLGSHAFESTRIEGVVEEESGDDLDDPDDLVDDSEDGSISTPESDSARDESKGDDLGK